MHWPSEAVTGRPSKAVTGQPSEAVTNSCQPKEWLHHVHLGGTNTPKPFGMFWYLENFHRAWRMPANTHFFMNTVNKKWMRQPPILSCQNKEVWGEGMKLSVHGKHCLWQSLRQAVMLAGVSATTALCRPCVTVWRAAQGLDSHAGVCPAWCVVLASRTTAGGSLRASVLPLCTCLASDDLSWTFLPHLTFASPRCLSLGQLSYCSSSHDRVVINFCLVHQELSYLHCPSQLRTGHCIHSPHNEEKAVLSWGRAEMNLKIWIP